MSWFNRLVRGTFSNAGLLDEELSLERLAIELGGNRHTTSGQDVTLRTAIGFPPLWRAINIICNDQMIPWSLKKWDKNGGKEDDTKHAAYQLIRRSPAHYMDSGTFKSVLQYHALMQGNAYAYVFRDTSARGGARPTELMILDPRFTFPVIEFTWNARKLWFVTTLAGSGEMRKLRAEDVIHIQGLSFDGIVGHAVLDILADPIGLGLAGQKFSSLYFANGGKAGGFLVHPGSLNAQQIKDIRETWTEMKPGIDGAHKPGVLFGGLDWKQTTIDPDKAQALMTRKFSITDISNVTGVRAHDLGSESTKGYNGVFAENQSHLGKTMMPWFRKFKMQHEDKLLTETQKETESHCIEYDLDELIIVEPNQQAEADKKDREASVATPNDIRRKRGLPLIPADQGGDDFHRPMNWTRLNAEDAKSVQNGSKTGQNQGQNDQNQPPNDPQNDPETTSKQRADASKQRAALHDLMVATASRLTKIEVNRLVEASKSPRDWLFTLESTLNQLESKWQDALAPVVRCCGHDGAAEYANEVTQSHLIATKQRLVALAECSAADLPSRVENWAKHHEHDEPIRLAAQVLGV